MFKISATGAIFLIKHFLICRMSSCSGQDVPVSSLVPSLFTSLPRWYRISRLLRRHDLLWQVELAYWLTTQDLCGRLTLYRQRG